jgi:hypothetical protein
MGVALLLMIGFQPSDRDARYPLLVVRVENRMENQLAFSVGLLHLGEGAT